MTRRSFVLLFVVLTLFGSMTFGVPVASASDSSDFIPADCDRWDWKTNTTYMCVTGYEVTADDAGGCLEDLWTYPTGRPCAAPELTGFEANVAGVPAVFRELVELGGTVEVLGQPGYRTMLGCHGEEGDPYHGPAMADDSRPTSAAWWANNESDVGEPFAWGPLGQDTWLSLEPGLGGGACVIFARADGPDTLQLDLDTSIVGTACADDGTCTTSGDYAGDPASTTHFMRDWDSYAVTVTVNNPGLINLANVVVYSEAGYGEELCDIGDLTAGTSAECVVAIDAEDGDEFDVLAFGEKSGTSGYFTPEQLVERHQIMLGVGPQISLTTIWHEEDGASATVYNDGDNWLTDITVTSETAGEIVCPFVELAPGAEMDCPIADTTLGMHIVQAVATPVVPDDEDWLPYPVTAVDDFAHLGLEVQDIGIELFAGADAKPDGFIDFVLFNSSPVAVDLTWEGAGFDIKPGTLACGDDASTSVDSVRVASEDVAVCTGEFVFDFDVNTLRVSATGTDADGATATATAFKTIDWCAVYKYPLIPECPRLEMSLKTDDPKVELNGETTVKWRVNNLSDVAIALSNVLSNPLDGTTIVGKCTSGGEPISSLPADKSATAYCEATMTVVEEVTVTITATGSSDGFADAIETAELTLAPAEVRVTIVDSSARVSTDDGLDLAFARVAFEITNDSTEDATLLRVEALADSTMRRGCDPGDLVLVAGSTLECTYETRLVSSAPVVYHVVVAVKPAGASTYITSSEQVTVDWCSVRPDLAICPEPAADSPEEDDAIDDGADEGEAPEDDVTDPAESPDDETEDDETDETDETEDDEIDEIDEADETEDDETDETGGDVETDDDADLETDEEHDDTGDGDDTEDDGGADNGGADDETDDDETDDEAGPPIFPDVDVDDDAEEEGPELGLVFEEGMVVHLINDDSGRYLDGGATWGSFRSRNNVDTSSAPAADDEWTLIEVAAGQWNLYNDLRGKYLDTDGFTSGYNVDMSTSARADDTWAFALNTDGTYTVHGVHRDRYLHEGSDTNVSTVNIDDLSDSARWQIVVVAE